jgi:Flp pilus assembly protein TadG
MKKLIRSDGQSLIEFAVALPLLMLMSLGVVEVAYALWDQHVVTKLAREGSNLISRDTTLQDAATALRTMSSQPVDFDADSTVIFSVLRRGATTGTANFDQIILYQRYQYGAIPATSHLQTGGGSYGGPPNYEAAGADNNTALQVTNVPNDLVSVLGGMIYVTEIFTNHPLLTPFDKLGVPMPTELYSIAYF